MDLIVETNELLCYLVDDQIHHVSWRLADSVLPVLNSTLRNPQKDGQIAHGETDLIPEELELVSVRWFVFF